ncbi:hypothetical protein AYO21_08865 [Fonsecaea monophora]|uniref:Uncharacterized protein n=1 Tax=Fonsecaea monophora TaxID=254056 RepID=A0A177EXV4_9EURO|nr:hypothetical protein AYO21_08865 [Fonsecaea monophora]KAH0827694.1 hypothetical protein FOPE_00103 [Fonsecaea pedrosoi]OAG36904.1 hypothetical protein AYO21_08865 [Fonsecaea monophora]
MLLKDSDGEYNELAGYAYEGVWERHDESALRKWIWTVTDSNALLILAGIALFIAVTQTRAWVIYRYVILTRTQVRPVRLPDESSPEPLLHLSQGKAIAEVLPFAKSGISNLWRKRASMLRRRTPQSAPEPEQEQESGSDEPATSPWFGIIALFNVAIFVTLGVVIPWLLSFGSAETPVVRSKATDSCLKSDKLANLFTLTSISPKSEAIFSQCLDRLDGGCDAPFYLEQPVVTKERLDYCPFPGNICHNQTRPFQITHSNVTARQLGVNSKAQISFNHRLTCAPVDLTPFLLFSRDTPIETWISTRNFDLPNGKAIWPNFTMPLNTMNGPNIVSNQSSGLRMAREHSPYDLTVLPRRWAGYEGVMVDPETLHKSIQRDDGLAYLIVYRAGATQYLGPVDDPFFAAHNMDWSNQTDHYYADREATALACFETSQYCVIGSGVCTPWGRGATQAYKIVKYPDLSVDSLAEVIALLRLLPSFFSVFTYLAELTEWHGMMPLKQIGIRPYMFTVLDDNREQWVIEVETWFRKTILSAILTVRHGARFHLNEYSIFFDNPKVLEGFLKRWSLCGRILFRDGNYTNINWIGFWAAMTLFGFICLLSFFIEQAHMTGAALCKTTRTLLIRLPRIGHKMKLAVTACGRQGVDGWRYWVLRFSRSHPLFHPATPARPRTRDQEQGPAAVDSELHDLGD